MGYIIYIIYTVYIYIEVRHIYIYITIVIGVMSCNINVISMFHLRPAPLVVFGDPFGFWDLERCWIIQMKLETNWKHDLWGFHKWGIPNSWLVYFMENPIKMDDMGVPPIWGSLHIVVGFPTPPGKINNTWFLTTFSLKSSNICQAHLFWQNCHRNLENTIWLFNRLVWKPWPICRWSWWLNWKMVIFQAKTVIFLPEGNLASHQDMEVS